ncbi:uncharacterized protein LOC62_06G007831 [Vanrija pseudolonga]|uniref:Uncharacterized protein n=1 Tax=Vanrija pseudolonga TaxID=143232 RepID=A0AAF1BT43_9TREE|nr:hypothetical protein LOC62_06G007831 [Vanrija pseudolonga]
MLLVYRNETLPAPSNDPRRRAAWKLAVSLVPVFIVLFFFLALCIWWIARLDSVYVQDLSHSLQNTCAGVRSAWDWVCAAPSSCLKRVRRQRGRPNTSSYAPVDDGAAEPLVYVGVRW